jgi:hypothetical protein
MTRQADTDATDEIARVAYAIWEEEGRPDGRDHEHWMKARRRLAEGRAHDAHPAGARAGDPGETSSGPPEARGGVATPGPRNPEPLPPGNAKGFATVPSEEDAAPGALGADPAPPPAGVEASPRKRGRSAAAKTTQPKADPGPVRPAGRKQMENPPSTWDKTDEEVDESFPASDPPGNY